MPILHIPIKKTLPLMFFAAALVFFGTARDVRAAWNGGLYQPGATLEPGCAPSQSLCDVDRTVTLDGHGGSYYLDAGNLNNFGTPFSAYFHATTTDALTEGTTNKYYSDSRVRTYLDSVPKSYFFATSSADFWKTQNDFFSTTSASYFLVQNGGSSFSTTSASYFLSQNLASAFSTTSANSWLGTKLTTDLAEGTNLYWTNARFDARFNASLSATSSLPNLSLSHSQIAGLGSLATLSSVNDSNWSGTALAPTNGGTGFSLYSTGDMLYADSPTTLARLPIGANGQVLKVQAGLPNWGVDATTGGGGGNDGIFATSTNIIYPIDSSNTFIVGSDATSTRNSIFEVHGQSYFSSKLGIGTTSPASALSVSGSGYLTGGLGIGVVNGTAGTLQTSGDATIGGNLNVTGSIVFASPVSVASGGTGSTTLSGILKGNGAGPILTAVAGTDYESPLTFGAGLNRTGNAITNTGVLTTAGDWTGTLDGQEGAYYLDARNDTNFGTPFYNFFHATTTDALAEGATNRYYADGRVQTYLDSIGKGYFFATSSAQYFLGQNQGASFSTTSASYFIAQNGGASFSTSSASYFLSQNIGSAFSTTSANSWLATKTTTSLAEGSNLYYTDARVQTYLDTVPKSYFFATSSADLWKSQNDFFSTTSASYFLTQNAGSAFSTTSAQYFLVQNQGSAFSTTSSNFWLGTKTTTDLAEGSNLYWTNARFDARLSATTSLPNLATLTALTSAPNLTSLPGLTSAANLASLPSLSLSATQLTNFGTPFYAFFHATTTDALAQGTTNKYYADSLARAAISASSTAATGLSYNSSTGSFSFASGYALDLTASTTNWNNFFNAPSTVIAAGSGVSWTGNTLSVATTSLNLAFSALTGTLGVSQGGTGAASYGQGWIYSAGGTAALAASTSPTVAWLTATSTSVASSFGLVTIGSPSITAQSPLAMAGSVDGYLQANIQNASAGTSASTDYVATANNGSDSSYYIDLGINGSAYNQAAYSVGGANSGYLYASDGSLTVGTASSTNSNAALIFHTGGTTASKERMRITQSGLVGIGTSTLQIENTLTLGQTSYNPTFEGGQLSLLPGSTATTSWAIDNYFGDFRLLKGNAVGTTTATIIQVASTTGNVTFSGRVTANGGFNGACFNGVLSLLNGVTSCNQDIAETYGSYEPTEPGDIIATPPAASGQYGADGVIEVGRSRGAAGETVLGVVSTNPGLVFDGGKTYLAGANDGLIGASKTVVALAGRVPVKVSLENGPIAPGDELGLSPTMPGFAVRALNPGPIVGIALQAYPAAGGATSTDSGAPAPKVLMFVKTGWSLGKGNAADPEYRILDSFALAVKTALRSMGPTIQQGILTVKGLVSDKVTTHELCLDDVCVTKNQLQTLLQQSGTPAEQPPTVPPPAPPASDPVPDTASTTPADPAPAVPVQPDASDAPIAAPQAPADQASSGADVPPSPAPAPDSASASQ